MFLLFDVCVCACQLILHVLDTRALACACFSVSSHARCARCAHIACAVYTQNVYGVCGVCVIVRECFAFYLYIMMLYVQKVYAFGARLPVRVSLLYT